MNATPIHISKISIDTPVHVVSDFYKNSIAPLKSVLQLSVGCQCYVPSGRGGVFKVTCQSINAGVIALSCEREGEVLDYVISLHAPVMSDVAFTDLFSSLQSKDLDKVQRIALFKAEEQGYMNIQSYSQYSLSSWGRARAKQLGLY